MADVEVRNLTPPTPTQLQLEQLQSVSTSLAESLRQLDQECWCNLETCTVDEPVCPPNLTARALEELQACFEFVIRSLTPARLTHFPEWCFVDQWANENERRDGTNDGIRTLEALLSGETRKIPGSGLIGYVPVIVTQRDADVATAVIQWLGTGCGRSFLQTVEQRIKASKLNSQAIWSEAVNAPPREDQIHIDAERIAAEFDPEAKRRSGNGLTLRAEIEAAIRVHAKKGEQS